MKKVKKVKKVRKGEKRREKERKREKKKEERKKRERREKEERKKREKERKREKQTVSNASLFCGTLEPTRMWSCARDKAEKRKQLCRSATVSSLCTDQHSPQLDLSLRSS